MNPPARSRPSGATGPDGRRSNRITSRAVPAPTATEEPLARSVQRGPVPRTRSGASWDRLRLSQPEVRRSAEHHARALEEISRSPVPQDSAGPWAAALARVCVEALLGARPATQLERWLTPELYDAVRRRAGLAIRVHGPARAQTPPRVVSHHAQVALDQRSAEVSVVLHDGTKVRAVALRLEAFRGRWRVGALEIG